MKIMNEMLIAIDFDGTIVTHEYPAIGREIPFAIETLKKMQSELFCRLILWTVREGKELDEAVEYCRKRGLEFYAVNSNYPEETKEHNEPRKLKVDLFIDDRNLGGLPDWGVIYQMLSTGKHFDLESLISPLSGIEQDQKRKRGIFGGRFTK